MLIGKKDDDLPIKQLTLKKQGTIGDLCKVICAGINRETGWGGGGCSNHKQTSPPRQVVSV
jgi:hypothetical protein